MPDKAPAGYTHINDATDKWGRNRNWWYVEVREGRLPGYQIPGLRGTYLRDEDVAARLEPKQIERGASGHTSRAG